METWKQRCYQITKTADEIHIIQLLMICYSSLIEATKWIED